MRSCSLAFYVASLLGTVSGTQGATLPAGYVPGQASSFSFRIAPVSNLGSYNVELLLTSTSGVAGTDFFFDLAGTQPLTAGYVFPDATNFAASANVLSGNRHSLTLSDFALAGVDVLAGVNDAIATIALRTLPDFSGTLSLSLNEESFQLDTPATTPTPVANFESALSAASSEADLTLDAVPEPTAILLVACGTIIAASTRGRRSPVVASC